MSGVADGVSDGVGVTDGVGLGVTGVFVGTGGRVFAGGRVATTVGGVGSCVKSGAGVKVGGNGPGSAVPSEASAIATAPSMDSSTAVGASVGRPVDAGWQAPRKIARTVKGRTAAAGRLRRNTKFSNIGPYSAAKGWN
jgi:hypothetical protein